MTDFSENYFSPLAERLRAQCKVSGELPDEERYQEWLKHWRVRDEDKGRGPRKPFQREVKIDCEFHDVPSLRQMVEGFTESETLAEARRVTAEWLRTTYEWAWAEVVKTDS